jgi:hypothetical protein
MRSANEGVGLFMDRLLLWSWAQGVGVAVAASKRARRCATSAARCAMNRRLSAGDTPFLRPQKCRLWRPRAALEGTGQAHPYTQVPCLGACTHRETHTLEPLYEAVGLKVPRLEIIDKPNPNENFRKVATFQQYSKLIVLLEVAKVDSGWARNENDLV